MRDMLRITIGLTVSCLIAAFFMGSVFTITEKAKKRNERQRVRNTMFELLGYSGTKTPPSKLKLYSIYRYTIMEGDGTNMGYMLPVRRRGDGVGYELLVVDLKGEFVKRLELDISAEEVNEASERNEALKEALNKATAFSYGDRVVIAESGSERLGYLLPGKFTGFKTFIKIMIALDQEMSIIGLEIMEHEEDPGLGGEIEEDYFKNQFKGKSFENLMDLEVTTEPLPEKYEKYLEAENRSRLFSREEIRKIQEKYKDDDIYALTGATISSRSVTRGAKNTVNKFAYRLDILEGVIESQNIPVAF